MAPSFSVESLRKNASKVKLSCVVIFKRSSADVFFTYSVKKSPGVASFGSA